MAKVIRRDIEAKLEALNGQEWDSMSEDEASDSEALSETEMIANETTDLTPAPLPLRVQKSRGRKGKGGGSVVPVGPKGQPSGVIYIGHIPHGFYEEAMNGFFGQFGDVIRVRLSRSKKSGRCKGYAYVEFASPEVAEIVASTMNGYFLFDKQLVCKVLKFDEIHPNLFDGAGHTFRKVNWHGLYRQKYNADRTPVQDNKHTAKLLAKDTAKRKNLAALGIKYDFPGFSSTVKGREVAEGPFQPKPKRDDAEKAAGSKKHTKKGYTAPKSTEEALKTPHQADGDAEVAVPVAIFKSSEEFPETPSVGPGVVKAAEEGSGTEKTPGAKRNKKAKNSPLPKETDKVSSKSDAITPSSANKGIKTPSRSVTNTTPSRPNATPIEPPSSGRSKGPGGKKKSPRTAPNPVVKETAPPASSEAKAKTTPKSAKKRSAQDEEREEKSPAVRAGSARKKPRSAKRARA